MIVCHRHKFIFIKTRKTAGTSLEIALSEYCDPGDTITRISPEDEATRSELGVQGPCNEYIPPTKLGAKEWLIWAGTRQRPRFYNHMPAKDARRFIEPSVWSSYFKFCFERDPWDKAVSQFYWTQDRHQQSFDDFILSGTVNSVSSFDIYTEQGSLLADKVFRYEDLQGALNEISHRCGLPSPLQMPSKKAKSNTGRTRKPFQGYYSSETSAHIAKVFAREVAYFDYEAPTLQEI